MFRFVTYTSDDGKEHCIRFNTEDQLWEWMQKFRSEKGQWPRSLAVYKGDCVFDAS